MSSVIEVQTKFGTLVAEPSNDPDYPEIIISLRDSEGRYLQLAVVGQMDFCERVDNEWKYEDALRIALWDTLEEDLAHSFVITKDDLDKPDAFWC